MEGEEYMNRKSRKQRLQRLVYSTIIITVIVDQTIRTERRGGMYLASTALLPSAQAPSLH